MLKIVEVATYLTEKLNEISNTQTDVYSFNIQAEVGANKNAKDVQGIVRTVSTKIAPRTKGRNTIYNLVVEFPIMSPTTNFNLVNIENCINLLAKQINGTQIAFESGKAIVTMGAGVVKDFKTDVGQGNVVPLSFEMSLNYTENVVAIKHWVLGWYENETLVSEEIPYISEQLIVEKEGRTNRIHDENYSKTLVLGQKHWYRFTFEYDADSKVCKKLQKDLFEGNANEKYTLSYYDDVIYTKTAPYETKVSVFTTGNGKSNFPNTADFDITFVDVEDGKNNTKYYLALCNNPFDKGGENTRCFSATSETVVGENNEPVVVTHTAQENQIAWYSALIQTDGADYDEIPAANISNIQLTDQVYINTRSYDLFDIVNMNYAIIKVVQGTGDNVKEHYFYYWTSNPQIGVNGQVSYTLELDSLQTYLFDPDFQIDDAFISQVHTNRWVKNLDGSVSFDGSPNSKLFERENLKNVAQRLVLRQKAKMVIETDPTQEHQGYGINEFLYDGVVAWAYVIMSRTGPETNGGYKVGDPTKVSVEASPASENDYAQSWFTPKAIQVNNDAGIDYNGHCALVFPILKDGYKMRVAGSWGEMSQESIDLDIGNSIRQLNQSFGGNQTSASKYIYNVKLSYKPPFPVTERAFYTISSDHKTLTFNSLEYLHYDEEGMNYGDWLGVRARGYDGIQTTTGSFYKRNWFLTVITNYNTNPRKIYILQDKDEMSGIDIKFEATEDLTPYTRNNFDAEEIAGVDDLHPVTRNRKFNPKLMGEDYRSFTVNMFGTNQNFDLQKMNQYSPVLVYKEALTADVAKIRIIPKKYNNSLFNVTDYQNSYNGLITTNDTGIETSTDQLVSYLANNKNAYLSFQKKQTNEWGNYAFSTANNLVSSVMSGNLLNVVGSVVGGGMQAGQLAYNQNYDRQQFDLSLDNMRAAPDTLNNANGNAIFNGTAGDIAPYYEIYEALPHELQMADDNMYRNGFTYNLIDDIYQFINAPVYDGTSGSKHIRRYFNYVKAVINNINGVSISNQARDDIRLRLANGVRFWHQDTIDYEHENYELWLNSLRT